MVFIVSPIPLRCFLAPHYIKYTPIIYVVNGYFDLKIGMSWKSLRRNELRLGGFSRFIFRPSPWPGDGRETPNCRRGDNRAPGYFLGRDSAGFDKEVYPLPGYSKDSGRVGKRKIFLIFHGFPLAFSVVVVNNIGWNEKGQEDFSVRLYIPSLGHHRGAEK